MRRYSEAIKADVRRRMSPPNPQSMARISEETGIHVATLYLWRKGWRLEGEVVPASQKDPEGMAEQKDLEKLHAQDQREIKALKKELQRKEKALAEAAALLVLRKKWEAFCSEDEEG